MHLLRFNLTCINLGWRFLYLSSRRRITPLLQYPPTVRQQRLHTWSLKDGLMMAAETSAERSPLLHYRPTATTTTMFRHNLFRILYTMPSSRMLKNEYCQGGMVGLHITSTTLGLQLTCTTLGLHLTCKTLG